MSDQLDQGHFRIEEPEWLDAGKTEGEPSEWILIAAEDVQMVEFRPERRRAHRPPAALEFRRHQR